ncbi:MAG: 30S ribosomal protein S9 [Chloroflexota bacterium]
MSDTFFEGIGRRKTATARVRVKGGSGQFVVNQEELEKYFPRVGDKHTILAPLDAVGIDRVRYDVSVLVKGGGVTGQAEAVQLGLTRALVKMDPDFRPALRKGGFLTRNARVKERKKPGLKRARKAPTYTKR